MEKMTALERRAVSSLASIMSLRLLGLFMVIPVFAIYAHTLTGTTPFLIGTAIGIYGLTQGLLQIPFGMCSDHIGRKPVILTGLIIFCIGSLIAALSHSIYIMILGRALQGAGAIGSTIIATIADLTRTTQRSKAMAINGMLIGISFSLAMLLGPVLAAWIQVPGIFWLAAACSIFGIILLFTLVPTPPKTTWHADAEPNPSQFKNDINNPALRYLYVGVFFLHMIFTASFVVIPIALQQFAGIASAQQWHLYVPALLLAFVCSIFMIVIAEKKQQVKKFFVSGIILLSVAELLLLLFSHSSLISALGLWLFFTAFSLLEAFLPSWVSRTAPKTRRGTALGIYSSAQFLGIFIGGMLGGWLYGAYGLLQVYLFCLILGILWLPLAIQMKKPQDSPH